MNELGREKLRKAALSGVGQTYQQYYTGKRTAFCAMGILLYWQEENVKNPFLEYAISDFSGPERVCRCPICEHDEGTEFDLIIHLNDGHKLDFLKIAEIAP